MPDKTTPVSENKVVITLVTANAGNIQAIIDKSKIYATRQEVEDDFNTHNVDPNAHANIIKKMQDVIAKLDTVYEKQQNLYKDIFHIGAMYISFDKTNPGTWMTGTMWELTGQGRTIVGAGTADSGNAYVAGAKGGSETNTLAVENMPPHAFKGRPIKVEVISILGQPRQAENIRIMGILLIMGNTDILLLIQMKMQVQYLTVIHT